MRIFIAAILTIFLYAMTSCSSRRGQPEIVEYSDSLRVTHSCGETGTLRAGLEYGFVENTLKTTGELESEMEKQFHRYYAACTDGDYASCVKYIDPEAFAYIKKFAKQDGAELDIESFSKMLCDDLSDMIGDIEDSGFEVNVNIGILERKVVYKGNIFIVFANATNLTSEDGISMHFAPLDENVALSKDAGKTWTFIALNEMFSPIYSNIYPENVIDAIMGY